MANVTVTMLQSGRTDEWGRPLVAGNSYSLDYDRAKSLWQAGFASVANPSVFDDDNTPLDGQLVRTMQCPDFKRGILASLAASSTAYRSGGTVTVTATSHGITTGATYVGYRYFYPGSPSLPAGWYDPLLSVPDANTLTFYAPGSDFASESVNGGVAYTSSADLCSVIIPGGTLKVNSKLSACITRSGDSAAVSKVISMLFGGSSLCSYSLTSSQTSESKIGFRCVEPSRQLGVNAAEAAASVSVVQATRDVSVDQLLVFRVSVASAGSFISVSGLHIEISQ